MPLACRKRSALSVLPSIASKFRPRVKGSPEVFDNASASGEVGLVSTVKRDFQVSRVRRRGRISLRNEDAAPERAASEKSFQSNSTSSSRRSAHRSAIKAWPFHQSLENSSPDAARLRANLNP